jgi:hypothetical protein
MIKRRLFNELYAHLEKPEISLITGPRQAGKTTLMFILMEKLKFLSKKVLFLNFDIEEDKLHLNTQADFLKKVKLEFGNEKGYIFIDEIQRKDNAGLFLKGIYDMNLPHKLIVSGSGSVELKEKVHESLAGRKRLFELSTLDFEEFINYKTDNRYENRIDDFLAVEQDKVRSILEEYINFGGYPRVVIEEKEAEKRKIIDEIYRSFLEKDIVFLLNIKKSDDFTRLFRLVAAQIGNLTNISELSSALGLSIATIKNYLWYLEKTYILDRVNPYFTNIRKEISKAPLYYFKDLGLRNYAAGQFGRIRLDEGSGFILENFVLLELLSAGVPANAIYFWRTKDGAEVDFIVARGEDAIPIEIKMRNIRKQEISRSFRSFIEKYLPAKAYLVNLGYRGQKKINKTEVNFILPHECRKIFE